MCVALVLAIRVLGPSALAGAGVAVAVLAVNGRASGVFHQVMDSVMHFQVWPPPHPLQATESPPSSSPPLVVVPTYACFSVLLRHLLLRCSCPHPPPIAHAVRPVCAWSSLGLRVRAPHDLFLTANPYASSRGAGGGTSAAPPPPSCRRCGGMGPHPLIANTQVNEVASV